MSVARISFSDLFHVLLLLYFLVSCSKCFFQAILQEKRFRKYDNQSTIIPRPVPIIITQWNVIPLHAYRRCHRILMVQGLCLLTVSPEKVFHGTKFNFTTIKRRLERKILCSTNLRIHILSINVKITGNINLQLKLASRFVRQDSLRHFCNLERPRSFQRMLKEQPVLCDYDSHFQHNFVWLQQYHHL